MIMNYVIENAQRILRESVARYDPSHIYVAYSGGKDSAIALDLSSKTLSDMNINVMAIDTGISGFGWRDMVKRHASVYGLTVEIVSGAGKQWYLANARKYGFAYTPNQHVIYYRMLKERAIRQLIKDKKANHYDRIMFITGVRRYESAKRSRTPESLRHGARVTVNPIVMFDDNNAVQYHSDYLKWYSNPYYAQYGNSGDCLCNWTTNISEKTLLVHNPELAREIISASDELESLGLWRYGNKPDSTQLQLIGSDSGDDAMPDDSLCISCYSKKLL